MQLQSLRRAAPRSRANPVPVFDATHASADRCPSAAQPASDVALATTSVLIAHALRSTAPAARTNAAASVGVNPPTSTAQRIVERASHAVQTVQHCASTIGSGRHTGKCELNRLYRRGVTATPRRSDPGTVANMSMTEAAPQPSIAARPICPLSISATGRPATPAGRPRDGYLDRAHQFTPGTTIQPTSTPATYTRSPRPAAGTTSRRPNS